MALLPNLAEQIGQGIQKNLAAKAAAQSAPQEVAPQGEQLDKDAVNLTKAIRQVESGGNFEARGGSGEYGAYQWMPGTWAAHSTKFLGRDVPFGTATPEEQNEVAYKAVKQYKDAGMNVGDIASQWNAGNQEAWKSGKAGTNAQGVNYNVAEYAHKVATAYQEIKAASANETAGESIPTDNEGYATKAAPIPADQKPQEEEKPKGLFGGLIHNLSGRLKQGAGAVSDTISGKINPVSGVLQTVGAVAGGLNDVVGAGTEAVAKTLYKNGVPQVVKNVAEPIAKFELNLLGKGLGHLAQTEAGQTAIKAVQDFQQEHPELSNDIKAGANIVLAIPILKSVGVLANVGKDAAATALKNQAEKWAAKDLAEVVSRTGGGREIVKEVPTAIETIVSHNAVPDLVTEGGVTRYSTEGSHSTIQKAIEKADEELFAELKNAKNKISIDHPLGDKVRLADLEDAAVKFAKDELKDEGPIKTMFERIRSKYGDYPTLEEVQDVKRTVQKQISEAAYGDPNMSPNKIIRRTLQHGIEDVAEKLGLDDIYHINQGIKKLIKTDKLLEYINGKVVREKGLIHQAIRAGSTGAGAALGSALGGGIGAVPGAIAGYGATNYVEGKLLNYTPRAIAHGILERAAPDAVRQTAGKTTGALKGLLRSAIINRSSK